MRTMVVDDDANEEELRRTAVDWVHRLDEGRGARADVEALKRWLAEDSRHRTAFADARRLWRQFGPAAHNLRERGELLPGLSRPVRRSQMSRRAMLGAGLAAASATAAYAVVHPPLHLWPSLEEFRSDYRTATGEQRQFTFQDDVSVRLNTQTSVMLSPSTDNVDRMELVTGQASFASMPGRPRSLVVTAGAGSITTSRASFDVWRTGQDVCVTCVEGTVSIERQADVQALRAGQQVRYDQNSMRSMASVDVDLVTAWQQGVLIFRMTPLGEVVDEINRYRSGRVILLDRQLAQKQISGRFRADHMDEILVRLNQAFGVKSRSLPGGIILLS